MTNDEPIPPDEATPATADWQTMAEISKVLSDALQGYLDTRVKKRLGGVDLTTMFMCMHNWHCAMLMGMAAQIAPTNPIGRKAFYMNARDTFDKRMNELIKQMEDILLKSAIDESESKRVRREDPD